MPVAIFDLDKTLIDGDSDFLWGEFMGEVGIVEPKSYQQKNQYFFDQYALGKLDINEYLRFCLQPLSQYPIKTLNKWHQQFMINKIKPITLPKAQKAVDTHRKKGDKLLVITATNRFVAKPIVAAYGIYNLLATELEIKNNSYTGKHKGEPCFQTGKVSHFKKWLKETNESLHGSSFYSDSHNDLPMLELVDNPVVVNADAKLQKIAHTNNWLSLDWR